MSNTRNLGELLQADGEVPSSKIDSVAATKLTGTIADARLSSGQQTAKLSLTGGAMTGAITTNSTFDGIDIATRDAVLTSTTTTANAALPKAGGAMTGAITTNSTFDGRDVGTDGTKLDGIAASANAYVHPNHSGDVVSTADGATVIQVDAVDIPMLSATGTASNTTFLRGDNAWAVPIAVSYTHLTLPTIYSV